VQHFITSYGVAAVFVLMLAESACIPVPSELIMLLGGALAAGAVAGAHPSLVLIIVAGVAGNLAGSYVAWAVGRYGGHAFVRRWGRYVGVHEHDIDRATVWFDRHGPAAVFFGRRVQGIQAAAAGSWPWSSSGSERSVTALLCLQAAWQGEVCWPAAVAVAGTRAPAWPRLRLALARDAVTRHG
jgi:membrane protein YqaA with SNARE-associated domain